MQCMYIDWVQQLIHPHTSCIIYDFHYVIHAISHSRETVENVWNVCGGRRFNVTCYKGVYRSYMHVQWPE